MVGPHVLVVEDDFELRGQLVRGLEEEGFRAAGVATGTELLGRLQGARADVLVIDIGLPDADGRDVCRALRAQGVVAPVLFLTARDALPDRLSGFSAGGDDYMTKPFVFAELAAHLRALSRRNGSGALEACGLRLDPARHAVSCGDREQFLTPTEFRLLACLLERPREAVRRRELVRAAWAAGAIVHENTLDAYIARLRRKLRDLREAPSIETARGVGYAIGRPLLG
jgi:two-component system, OmpR family, response regulator